jgi:hypothetical protein
LKNYHWNKIPGLFQDLEVEEDLEEEEEEVVNLEELNLYSSYVDSQFNSINAQEYSELFGKAQSIELNGIQDPFNNYKSSSPLLLKHPDDISFKSNIINIEELESQVQLSMPDENITLPPIIEPETIELLGAASEMKPRKRPTVFD